MRIAVVLLALGLLTVAAPLAVPAVDAACTGQLDMARACVAGGSSCLVYVKLMGDHWCFN